MMENRAMLYKNSIGMYGFSEGGQVCYQDQPQVEVEQVSLQDILCLYF